ncbi:YeeE/YedE thiosulfate transporter family protein [Enterovibrio paralichthyis]|uniref:YeeE/YedE thiosulfate transporter family protein n=1 Tax=Enterovibrio paralichthyis TaxID=2853805 RepID=UPI001C4910EE|nr:YeeE/YedE thiosulfate transporter family protein [Enterovibrio paralichthyis]MBV7298651.1 YeeE/YedE family protein [Enterovibrio paralichthyis]
MDSFLKQREWGWFQGGIALAAIFLLSAILVQPIGVSTQFVIFDGIVLDSATDLTHESATNKSGFESNNAYLNKSGGKYAESVEHPLNYAFVFVLSMILGGALGKWSSRTESQITTYQSTSMGEYLKLFIGGFLVLFGARMAGGCTSGHMMSGMMQTSVSGYAFAIAVFAVAVPTAIFLKKRGGSL